MADIDPATFRTALLDHGAVLLRSAVPDSIIGPLRAEIDAMMDHYAVIPQSVIDREFRFEPGYLLSHWDERLRLGTYYNQDLITFSQGRHSLFDVLRGSGLAALTELAFPEKLVWENFVTNVRRVYPAGSAADRRAAPLTIHVDAQFHQHDTLGINFWTPLISVGQFRPSLQVLPLGIEDTKKFLDYSEVGHVDVEDKLASMNHFRCDRMEPSCLEAAGLIDQFWMPTLDAGDVLAFSNFTMHATYVRPDMTLPRTSIEARILLKERPFGDLRESASDPSANAASH